jgi:hypothetical protein
MKPAQPPEDLLRASLILEVGADSREDALETIRTLGGAGFRHHLQGTTLAGHPVVFATNPVVPVPSESCWVPHHGHDINCPAKCRGEDVLRLFGVEAFLDAATVDGTSQGTDRDLFGTYEIAPGVEIRVSGQGVCGYSLEDLFEYRHPAYALGRTGTSYENIKEIPDDDAADGPFGLATIDQSAAIQHQAGHSSSDGLAGQSTRATE